MFCKNLDNNKGDNNGNNHDNDNDSNDEGIDGGDDVDDNDDGGDDDKHVDFFNLDLSHEWIIKPFKSCEMVLLCF